MFHRLTALLSLLTAAGLPALAQPFDYPDAARGDVVDVLHGTSVATNGFCYDGCVRAEDCVR